MDNVHVKIEKKLAETKNLLQKGPKGKVRNKNYDIKKEKLDEQQTRYRGEK